MKKTKLSKQGYEKLRNKLKKLKKKKWELAEELKKASEHGDLRENSEFLYTKDELHVVKCKIKKVKEKIKNSEIIDKNNIDATKVSIGTIVKVKDLDTEEVLEYNIVSIGESDPGNDKIANNSPVAKALIGKNKDDVIKVKVPDRKIKYKILSIKKA